MIYYTLDGTDPAQSDLQGLPIMTALVRAGRAEARPGPDRAGGERLARCAALR